MLFQLGTLAAAPCDRAGRAECGNRSLREEDPARVGIAMLSVSQHVDRGAAGRAAAGFDAGDPARRELRSWRSSRAIRSTAF